MLLLLVLLVLLVLRRQLVHLGGVLPLRSSRGWVQVGPPPEGACCVPLAAKSMT